MMNLEEKCQGERLISDFEEEEGEAELCGPVGLGKKIEPNAALFPELKRCPGNSFLRESLIGFRDGVPGTFSGYKENTIRSSIRASIREKQPFFSGDNKGDNYCLVTEIPNFMKNKDVEYFEVEVEMDRLDEENKKAMNEAEIEESSNGDEDVSDDDKYTYDLSAHFKPRYSIKDQHVLIANNGRSFRVESGMRYFDPRNNCPRKASSSFLVPLSNEEENMSELSGDSDTERLIEKSDEFVPDDKDIYEAIGTPRTSLKGGTIPENLFCPDINLHTSPERSASSSSVEHIYSNVNYDYVRPCVTTNTSKIPRLPPRNSIVYYSEDDKETYFEVELKEQENSVQLPPLPSDATDYQRKRYQLIKCIMEKEHTYMKSLRRLVKEYEEPIIENGIVDKECVKGIFKHVHEIMQCHQLFNMALSYRANEWSNNEVIGDVILASFSKAMVFKAYCNFVCSFSVTMDSIKETCKSVPAFFNFLKNKEYDRKARQSLYYLMCQPLQYISDLVILTETLLMETPFPHPDRKPLQMALTHLECLCETLSTERMNIIMKERVKVLDAQCIGLESELATSTGHFIRYDDMLLCETENGNLVKTKPHRIFLLDNYIVCASFLSKRQQMQLMTNKVYKVKWCFPITDVNIVDVTSGIYINTDMVDGCDDDYYQVYKGQHPSKYMEDLLHDLTMVGDIMGKVSSLRLSHTFIDSNKVNEWYKEIHKKLDDAMETANMNWIEISVPSMTNKGKREEWLFNVSSPRKKFEWTNEFENINLRLGVDNNPGWYLQEENIYEHEVVNLQRALPLVASVQPLFMISADTSVVCVLDLIAPSSNKPILWIFSGNDKLGVITLMEMKVPSSLNVLHSYIASNERICTAEIVWKREDQSRKNRCPYVWVGTLSGRILIYDALAVNERQPMMSVSLEDSIVSIKYTYDMVFVGLANGNLLRFEFDTGPTWDLSNPTVISLSLNPVMSIVVSCDRLWCASGSAIFVVDAATMFVEEEVAACENRKGTIKQMIPYGIGVWVSMRKSSILLLYHGETMEQLQMINATTPIARMKEELEGPIRDICIENIYVTSVLAKEGMLWVAVDKGLIVTYPLPKLGGIPIVSGKACVSFHAHNDSVKHLHAFSVQRSFQAEDDIFIQEVDGDNSSTNSPTGTSPLTTSKNVIKSKTKNGGNGLDPEYFVLEYDQPEVAPRIDSLSSSDESLKNKDSTMKHSYMNVDNEMENEEGKRKQSEDVLNSDEELYFTQGDLTRTPVKKATVVTNTDELDGKDVLEQGKSMICPNSSISDISSMLENIGFDEKSSNMASNSVSDELYDTPEMNNQITLPEIDSGKNTSSKAEIPLTYPTKRRNKRLSAVRAININEPIDKDNSESTSAKTIKSIEKDLPDSFFVQGESFSAYDVKSKPAWESFVEDDGHIYEVPLKVCQEFYTTLDGHNARKSSIDDIDVEPFEEDVKLITKTSSVKSNKPQNVAIIDRRKIPKMSEKPPSTSSLSGIRRNKNENELLNNSLPTSTLSNPDNRTIARNSLLANARIDSFDSTDYIPPLSRKYESAKGSDSVNGEHESDFVKNSWYILSIGSGHLDLRQYTRHSEYVNLSNPPVYDGKEALLLLWKLNAAKHFYR